MWRATVNVSYDEGRVRNELDEVYDPSEAATLSNAEERASVGGTRCAVGRSGNGK